VHPGGVEEVVADKGYHSHDVAVGLAGLGMRSYIAEPERGARHWEGSSLEVQIQECAALRRRRRAEKRLPTASCRTSFS